MKFTVLQQDFLPAIQTVARSIGSKSALPVLDNILLSIEENRLKISATNLEIGIIKFIPVEVVEAGDVTVPAKTLVDIIAGLKQVKLEIESSNNIIVISAGKFKAKINGMPSSEFPVIPLTSSEGVSFEKSSLQSCAQILFASAVDEGRPILTGILTQASNGFLDFIATDGFRLAHKRVSIEDKNLNFKSLIPRKTYEEVIKILAEENTSVVKISTSGSLNQAIFDFGNTTISSRLIEGNFPVWEKIIPTQIVSKLKIEKTELLKAMKLAAVFARSESNVIVIKLSKNGIQINSSAKELGNQENEVEGMVEGEDLEIAFNAKFLIDAISNCPSEEVDISFSGALSSTLIKPIGDFGLEYIVMPVRLN